MIHYLHLFVFLRMEATSLIHKERKSFAGTIAFLSGDNLGFQLIGGFKEGPGAHTNVDIAWVHLMQ